jgi:LacI family transcriptional regulator
MPKHSDEASPTEAVHNPSTIKDVAERARVSTATVSRVISGSGRVSKRLEQRVRNAILTLDYRPNQVARRLRKRNTQIVGVVISDIQNPFFAALVEGIDSILKQNDYLLLLGSSSENPQREQQHLRTFLSEVVSGIIFATTGEDTDIYSRIQQEGIPLVAVDRKPGDFEVDSVQVANEAAASQAIDHLVAEGHQRIGLIAGPSQLSTAMQRLAGYRCGLQAAGLPIDPDLIQGGDFRQPSGYQAMRRLLELPRPPSAVLVSNNLMTLGALQMIHERGLHIPQEIALIGFDDMPWASSLRPALTVIAQPVYEMGVLAAQLLLARIQEPHKRIEQIVLDTELIVRASCWCLGSQGTYSTQAIEEKL